jgi:Family of unknown function (DUF6300)
MSGSAQPGGPGEELAGAGDPPPCPRCGGEGLLSVSVPHSWQNNRGDAVHGRHVVVLCQTCDAADPSAVPLILFFTVHGQVSEQTASEFTDLARRWAASVKNPQADQAALEQEVQAWHRGELDDDLPSPAPGPYIPGDERLEWPESFTHDDGSRL